MRGHKQKVTKQDTGAARPCTDAEEIRTYVHTYIQTYIQTYIHAYIHAYIHTYIHTYTCIQVVDEYRRRFEHERKRLAQVGHIRQTY